MNVRLIDYRVFHRKHDEESVDSQTFTIQMFGVNETGETFSIEVPDFKPCFYCVVPEHFNTMKKNMFLEHVKTQVGRYYAESILECILVKRKKLDGFDGQREHKFICFKFRGMPAFNKIKNLWFEERKTPVSKFSPDGKKWVIKPFGYKYNGDYLKIYESNIPPLLRYFHIKEISPSGWVRIPSASLNPDTKTTTCTYEFVVKAKDIDPVDCEMIVPFKICSFDIEASSSHGDFPLPVKDYKKLAQNILEMTTFSSDILYKAIRSAFGFDVLDNIDLVYPKTVVTEAQLETMFDEWIHLSFKDYKPDIVEQSEVSDDDSDVEVTLPIQYNQNSTVPVMLNDPDFPKDSKTIELTRMLNSVFPPLEGDKVTFIGSTFVKYGEMKPYLNHCIVLNGCSPVENVTIESYKTEKEVLLAWKHLIQRENPDILIGYNIFGFDEDFMFRRSVETGCVTEFLDLTKNCDSLAGSLKDEKWGIEETSVFIASGEYNLKYFKTEGRLQIDLYTLFRRDYNLDSYKLDSVSAYFIGDKVSQIRHHENTTIVYSKNLQGLEKTNYVVFEEITHTSDYYRNGKKFKVLDIQPTHFVIETIASPNMRKEVKWCLAKDDVTHHDIFRMANGSDDDRAVIATYCVQDCNLVHNLMRKIDVLTGFVEMSNICSVPIQFLVMRGQGIKLTSYIAKKCREKGVLMPVLETHDYEDGYEGAIVLEPKRNIYSDDPVAVCDYSSLYPSCMISEGLSHDSKVWTKEYNLHDILIKETGKKDGERFVYDNLPDYSYVNVTYDTYKYVRKTPKAAAVKVISGYKICRFAQFPEGKPIMPSVLEELLAARSETRKLIPKQTDDFMKNVLDKRQLAYKVTANSLYGQCGAKTSTFYDKDVAASCTATGRKLLIYAKTVIEEVYSNKHCDTTLGTVVANAEYVYGDTDSVFFKFNLKNEQGEKIIGKDALQMTIELAKEAGHLASGCLKPPHDLAYEKTFLPLVLLSKKRYVGMLYENDVHKCSRKSMGIVLKRRDNAPIVKDIYGGVIDILMKERDIQKSIDFVQSSLQQLVNGTVHMDKLVITKSLRSGYKNPTQISHKVLADRIGKRDSGNKPRPGDRIQFVYIKGNKKSLQGERIETPEYIRAHGLVPDYTHYITNQIMKPIQQVFALVLEDIPSFQESKPRFLETLQKFRAELDDEKYEKKELQLRNKEVKILVFDNYL